MKNALRAPFPARFFCGKAAKKCAKMLNMTEKSKHRYPALARKHCITNTLSRAFVGACKKPAPEKAACGLI
jgi:hypothetical protein